jgi:hypothetical protein
MSHDFGRLTSQMHGREDHEAEQQHHDVGDEKAAVEAVDHFRRLLEQHRTGLQAVDEEPAEEHRGRVRAGMPRLNSGTSAVAVTTLFAHSGAATPSGDPFPNSSGAFDQRFASEYAMNAGDRAARSRRDALERSDHRPDRRRLRKPLHHLEVRQLEARTGRVGLRPRRLADLHQHFGDGEEPDHHEQRLDAAEQVRLTEREARNSRHRVGARRLRWQGRSLRRGCLSAASLRRARPQPKVQAFPARSKRAE